VINNNFNNDAENKKLDILSKDVLDGIQHINFKKINNEKSKILYWIKSRK
jgi:hypothetical protein